MSGLEPSPADPDDTRALSLIQLIDAAVIPATRADDLTPCIVLHMVFQPINRPAAVADVTMRITTATKLLEALGPAIELATDDAVARITQLEAGG